MSLRTISGRLTERHGKDGGGEQFLCFAGDLQRVVDPPVPQVSIRK